MIEARCPFCYSNHVVSQSTKADSDFTCLKCGMEFGSSYVLYAIAREKKRLREDEKSDK